MKRLTLLIILIPFIVGCVSEIIKSEPDENKDPLPYFVTKPTFMDIHGNVKEIFEFGETVIISDCYGKDKEDIALEHNLTIKFPGISSFTIRNVSLTFTETNVIGTYEVNCSATDSKGNINSSTSSFKVGEDGIEDVSVVPVRFEQEGFDFSLNGKIAIAIIVVIIGFIFIMKRRNGTNKEINYCEECGAKLNKGDTFCEACGGKVK